MTVPVIDDISSEGPEMFYGLLMTNEERVTLLPPQTNITILDDEGMLPYQNGEAEGPRDG